jgi:hypothetical protein
VSSVLELHVAVAAQMIGKCNSLVLLVKAGSFDFHGVANRGNAAFLHHRPRLPSGFKVMLDGTDETPGLCSQNSDISPRMDTNNSYGKGK